MDPEGIAEINRVTHGGERDRDLLEFSANVNPETPTGTASAYREALSVADRYPDDGYPEFRRAAADAVSRDTGRERGVDPDTVVPTAGGLAAIRLAIATTVDSGDAVLVPRPGFGEYAREIRLAGATPAFVPHDRIPHRDPEGYAAAIVCTPNNPTGETIAPPRLREFAARCRSADTTLLVDEAFLGFTDRPTAAGTDGVVVMRSLTKLYGLPGIRAGYAVATGTHLQKLQAARPPWNLSTPAAAVGTHCLRDETFVERTRRRVRTERARLKRAFEDIGVAVHPSEAPFLLLELGDRDVDRVVAGFRREGIAVRDARSFRTLDTHVRVAVRGPDENDRLLEAGTVVLDG